MVILCNMCNNDKEGSEIILLRCSHAFCWECIENYLKENLDNKYKCPVQLCQEFLRDSEVRRILSKNDTLIYEAKCLDKLPSKHWCLLPDCGEIYLYDNVDIQFDCRKCSIFNCIKCQVAHKGMLCDETVSKTGPIREVVYQNEISRAQEVLKKKNAVLSRGHFAKMEENGLVSNSAVFVCEICTMCISKYEGIIIRQCFHKICRTCLRDYVKNCQTIPVTCPFSECKIKLEDRECREILPELDRNIYEMKCIMYASRNFNKTERCRQFNCSYLCDVDRNVKQWTCKTCNSVNCVTCGTIHDNETCQKYMNSRITCNEEMEIEKCIKERKYMRCLCCDMLITKISGCNWIQCPACQSELCWINQMYRWGPKGRGDTSGGCKCGVNGKMCHPDCVGCIPHSQCLIM